jgi:hypothetical protein
MLYQSGTGGLCLLLLLCGATVVIEKIRDFWVWYLSYSTSWSQVREYYENNYFGSIKFGLR